jgi:hypothetical protein
MTHSTSEHIQQISETLVRSMQLLFRELALGLLFLPDDTMLS